MTKYTRSIPLAVDKSSGEIIYADQLFSVTRDAFQIRKSFHEKGFQPSCIECDQELDVSGSKFDRIHFKHRKGSQPCILSDSNVTIDDHLILSNILVAKESERHMYLKNRIGKLLAKVDGVEKESISIDRKFIIKPNGKRKPDVYCKYLNKEIVFEIQLSDLSLSYILNRFNFYKENGIYLIWILDNFDIYNQKTLERDIKYLAKYENFFKLDESKPILALQCDYKGVFLTDKHEVWSSWQSKSVALKDLKFDDQQYQAYFYDFDEHKRKTEILRKSILEKQAQEEKERIAKELEVNAVKATNEIISELKYLKKTGKQYYWKVVKLIRELSEYELDYLNHKMKLKERFERSESPLVQAIENATENESSLITFLLTTPGLYIDVNVKGKSGKTAFQSVLANNKINYYSPILNLFLSGYELKTEDIQYLKTFTPKNDKMRFYIDCYILIGTRLKERSFTKDVLKYGKTIFIIESLKRKEMIGIKYKPGEWIRLANYAIDYHNEYWIYIKTALQYYGLWDKLPKLDFSGSYKNKLSTVVQNLPAQNMEFESVFFDLYPELISDYLIYD